MKWHLMRMWPADCAPLKFEKSSQFVNFNVTCAMQDMLVTLAAISTNALKDTNKNRHQFVNIILEKHNSNVPPGLSEQFHMLTKCSNNFYSLIKKWCHDDAETSAFNVNICLLMFYEIVIGQE